MMDDLFDYATKKKTNETCNGADYLRPRNVDITVQLGLSLVLGISAFTTFCILRPRWSSLYAARKRRLDPTIGLPALPDTFFGWIPGLFRVTEEQVLASAGLDAFVFLSFFKMSIRLLSIMAFFAYAVLLQVNRHFMSDSGHHGKHPSTAMLHTVYGQASLDGAFEPSRHVSAVAKNNDKAHLWAWLVFTYFFTALTIYIVNKETFRVIRVRQEYLGTQSTITDRTFRLTGLPSNLKDEQKIKELIEGLEIGQVETVSLCRNWKELDGLVAQREAMLRKLEEAWSVYLGKQSALPKSIQRLRSNRIEDEENQGSGSGDSDEQEDAGENGRLLSHEDIRPELIERQRPSLTLRYGLLGLRTRKTDAIDYYEEKLRRLDDKIIASRKKTPAAASTAFVTMDSIAACQMAIQARIDPRPGQLLTKPAPSPSDVIWANTYTPRGVRRLRSWVITIFVTLLSLVWIGSVASLAGLLTICNLKKWFPNVVATLDDLPVLRALIETGLPTLLVSLLNVAVPYLYDFLSYQQGMISKGDVELSIISKNFFFSFFNIFIVFAISSTAINIFQVVGRVQDGLRDTGAFARFIAGQINDLSFFYTNFIMLQGLGLFPFRLLEVGSVLLYPIYRMGAKTPRDFAQIMSPPVFSYGFYLPTALLVFILCLVYSVIQYGYLVLTVGLVYFTFGYFTYKYQLLYAMDQPQHATGGAWRIICNRVVLGLFVFQVVMISEMALESAFIQSVLTFPLIFLTIWYNYYFSRRFVPLTYFIALRSIVPEAGTGEEAVADDEDFDGPRPSHGLLRRGSTIDEDKEKGMKFVNPSLTYRLENPWIYQDPPPTQPSEAGSQERLVDVQASPDQGLNHAGTSESSLSLGDAHIWRDNSESRA
ncbi:hypothetical protein VD0002_g6456 [Verticillium dahliae]|nr:hypothetical protein BJF96_g6363 [Verticillium dahliae]PNH49433.1 hypothetical protein VD0003_g7711 [Verticillium dahliae]PNH61329.1 hypothetical protein VD0002_g6456 [Verticillium dahliae]